MKCLALVDENLDTTYVVFLEKPNYIDTKLWYILQSGTEDFWQTFIVKLKIYMTKVKIKFFCKVLAF